MSSVVELCARKTYEITNLHITEKVTTAGLLLIFLQAVPLHVLDLNMMVEVKKKFK
jgi:hypothetical protein